MVDSVPIRKFEALSEIPNLVHGFVDRIPNLPTNCDKEEALLLLAPYHQKALEHLGLDTSNLWMGAQSHGVEVISISSDKPDNDSLIPGVDGFISKNPNTVIGIHVADCCAVYLVDQKKKRSDLYTRVKKVRKMVLSKMLSS